MKTLDELYSGEYPVNIFNLYTNNSEFKCCHCREIIKDVCTIIFYDFLGKKGILIEEGRILSCKNCLSIILTEIIPNFQRDCDEHIWATSVLVRQKKYNPKVIKQYSTKTYTIDDFDKLYDINDQKTKNKINKILEF